MKTWIDEEGFSYSDISESFKSSDTDKIESANDLQDAIHQFINQSDTPLDFVVIRDTFSRSASVVIQVKALSPYKHHNCALIVIRKNIT
jgi:hypothetical protein